MTTLFDMDAVTEPIWAVPATRAGRVAMVTELPTVTEPICAVPAPIVTVPPPIVTTPMRFVPAGRAEPIVTVPEMGRGFPPAIVP